MSDAPGTDDPESTIKAMVNGYEALKPRQHSGPEWRVLSLRGDEPTAHKVNLDELECDCRDQSMNKSDPEICDHLAVALERSNVHLEMDEMAPYHIETLVDRAQSAVRAIEDVRDVAQASHTADVAQAAADAPAEEPEDPDPLELLDRKLEDLGLDPDDFEAWIDDEYNSLQFEKDANLSEEDYSTFMDWVGNSSSDVQWDRDNQRNYIKQDDIGSELQ